jgi:hypothetical protein
MVLINITGNPRLHRLSYGRGIVSVPKVMAEKMIGFGIAEYVEKPIQVETATIPEPKTETADAPTPPIVRKNQKPKPKRKRKK